MGVRLLPAATSIVVVVADSGVVAPVFGLL